MKKVMINFGNIINKILIGVNIVLFVLGMIKGNYASAIISAYTLTIVILLNLIQKSVKEYLTSYQDLTKNYQDLTDDLIKSYEEKINITKKMLNEAMKLSRAKEIKEKIKKII